MVKLSLFSRKSNTITNSDQLSQIDLTDQDHQTIHDQPLQTNSSSSRRRLVSRLFLPHSDQQQQQPISSEDSKTTTTTTNIITNHNHNEVQDQSNRRTTKLLSRSTSKDSTHKLSRLTTTFKSLNHHQQQPHSLNLQTHNPTTTEPEIEELITQSSPNSDLHTTTSNHNKPQPLTTSPNSSFTLNSSSSPNSPTLSLIINHNDINHNQTMSSNTSSASIRSKPKPKSNPLSNLLRISRRNTHQTDTSRTLTTKRSNQSLYTLHAPKFFLGRNKTTPPHLVEAHRIANQSSKDQPQPNEQEIEELPPKRDESADQEEIRTPNDDQASVSSFKLKSFRNVRTMSENGHPTMDPTHNTSTGSITLSSPIPTMTTNSPANSRPSSPSSRAPGPRISAAAFREARAARTTSRTSMSSAYSDLSNHHDRLSIYLPSSHPMATSSTSRFISPPVVPPIQVRAKSDIGVPNRMSMNPTHTTSSSSSPSNQRSRFESRKHPTQPLINLNQAHTPTKPTTPTRRPHPNVGSTYRPPSTYINQSTHEHDTDVLVPPRPAFYGSSQPRRGSNPRDDRSSSSIGPHHLYATPMSPTGSSSSIRSLPVHSTHHSPSRHHHSSTPPHSAMKSSFKTKTKAKASQLDKWHSDDDDDDDNDRDDDDHDRQRRKDETSNVRKSHVSFSTPSSPGQVRQSFASIERPISIAGSMNSNLASPTHFFHHAPLPPVPPLPFLSKPTLLSHSPTPISPSSSSTTGAGAGGVGHERAPDEEDDEVPLSKLKKHDRSSLTPSSHSTHLGVVTSPTSLSLDLLSIPNRLIQQHHHHQRGNSPASSSSGGSGSHQIVTPRDSSMTIDSIINHHHQGIGNGNVGNRGGVGGLHHNRMMFDRSSIVGVGENENKSMKLYDGGLLALPPNGVDPLIYNELGADEKFQLHQRSQMMMQMMAAQAQLHAMTLSNQRNRMGSISSQSQIGVTNLYSPTSFHHPTQRSSGGSQSMVGVVGRKERSMSTGGGGKNDAM